VRASLVESLLTESVPTRADSHVSAPRNSSSKLATIIIVTKYCFGNSFLLMPYGCKIAGLIGGPLYLIVVYVFMMWGLHTLIESRKEKGPGCYADLGLVWGNKGQILIHWSIVLTAFGFNCIWISSTVDFLGVMLPTWSITARLFLFLPLVAMLTLVRHLKFFTVTNLLGVCICAITFVYILCYAFVKVLDDGAQSVLFFDTTNLNSLHWLAQCGYTYELIIAVMPIYESAADKESVALIIYVVAAIWTILCITIGCVGQMAFGEGAQRLAILNLPSASVAGYILSGLFSFTGVFTQPINNFVICLSYEPLCRWSSHPLKRKWMKNLVRLVIVSFTYAITWLGGAQLQHFVELVGGVFGMMIALVIPCLLHLTICKPVGLTRIINYLTAALGVVIMGVSLYNTLSTWRV